MRSASCVAIIKLLWAMPGGPLRPLCQCAPYGWGSCRDRMMMGSGTVTTITDRTIWVLSCRDHSMIGRSRSHQGSQASRTWQMTAVCHPSASLRLDIGVADDAAVFVLLLVNVRAEIRVAEADRIEAEIDELRLDLGDLHRGGKPGG